MDDAGGVGLGIGEVLRPQRQAQLEACGLVVANEGEQQGNLGFGFLNTTSYGATGKRAGFKDPAAVLSRVHGRCRNCP